MGDYVYRLDITYPEGFGPGEHPWGWYPEGWDAADFIINTPEGPDYPTFSWPQERRFLSRKGAENRAERLRGYGCAVEVVRSEPIQWPDRGGA